MVMAASKIYRDYEEAFSRGTKLPIALHQPEMLGIVEYPRGQGNPFCALMAGTNRICSDCYSLQQRLEKEAKIEAKTLKCFAGMCETAIPVRVGENLIAFLHTGQVFLQRPSKAQFNRVASMLIQLGTEIDLKKVEELYFNTRVLTRSQYEALISLLTIFAEHLAECSRVLVALPNTTEPRSITKAREFITLHSHEAISLAGVAHAVNMSANYFSEKFKLIAGLNFVDFVARVRVEKARNLLLNPHRRIGEVAYEVGFQSLSQFNRAFLRLVGCSPTDYRKMQRQV